MIIDFHAHTFPDKIASVAVQALAKSSDLYPYVDGTVNGLIESMKENDIDYSVILPIVTKPSQLDTINATAINTNEAYGDKGIISFGSVHPENSNYKAVIKSLKSNGVKGIKLHPVFQGVPFDDIRFMNIVEAACEEDLIILVHGGDDLSFPGVNLVGAEHIKNVVKAIKPNKMIMAHMGAWGHWEDILELLAEYPLLMDTSFTLRKGRRKATIEESSNTNTITYKGDTLVEFDTPFLSNELFTKMVQATGAQNVFFGSDSPWNSQKEAADAIRQTGLNDNEIAMILGDNAKKLLF